jgi:hypothetical protein
MWSNLNHMRRVEAMPLETFAFNQTFDFGTTVNWDKFLEDYQDTLVRWAF